MNNSFLVRNCGFLLLLAYGLILTGLNLNFGSPYHDEALNIQMGYQVLGNNDCPGCAQNTGSVAIQPVIAAAGDALAGLKGARAAGILFALSLTGIIYLATLTRLSRALAIFASMVFLFSGPVLYLSTLATYDIVAAFFLGLSFYCILRSSDSAVNEKSWLLAAAIALFLAAITKYVVAVFVPPLIIFVLLQRNRLKGLMAFVVPLLLLTALYFIFALYPVIDTLRGSMLSVYSESQVSGQQLASWAFRWVAMPYLLAMFGIFHKRHGRTAMILMLLSTPVILFHLLTGAEQSVNKNVVFSLVFLAPAAAIGIDHLGNIFSFNSSENWVKTFFTLFIFIVLWAFGLNQMRWLQKQYPDTTEIMEFFERNGQDGMWVIIDSDFGDAVYSYGLKNQFPRARFQSIAEFYRYRNETDRSQPMPDYIILDDYYTKKPYRKKALDFIGNGNYTPAATFIQKLSWGDKSVSIYQRRKL